MRKASAAEQFLSFGRQGVWHIWIGFDHILFLLALLLHPLSWALAAIYPARIVRLAGRTPTSGWLWATFVVLASFAETAGAFKYWLGRARRQRVALIEYK